VHLIHIEKRTLSGPLLSKNGMKCPQSVMNDRNVAEQRMPEGRMSRGRMPEGRMHKMLKQDSTKDVAQDTS
jgi:hypothetical protein